MTNFFPQEGAVYRHYKGGLYQVLMVVRREGDQERMVVYQPQDGTIPWVRPLSEFAEKFSYVSNTGWEVARPPANRHKAMLQRFIEWDKKWPHCTALMSYDEIQDSETELDDLITEARELLKCP